ncbi:unnamed protein product [Hymenolepis diminuta]|uniref:phosphatidylinositol-4-phosphate 3-kinase n=1 Tax=Hymenolepis diminuta TaxID=6216 RepID=A0A564XY14_HYMDI|nr:unnamed protein product [Hymenolepis diminuta]
MSYPFDDLISFNEPEKNGKNSPKCSVLEEFDPLFGTTLRKSRTTRTNGTYQFTECNFDNLRKENVSEETRSSSQNRIGGIFDKDLIWDKLNVFACHEKSVRSYGLSPAVSSPSLSSLGTSLPLPLIKQEPRSSHLLCDNISVDKSLLNFAKAVDNCAQWLPSVRDKFPSPQCTKLGDIPIQETPVALNGYLIDGIVGSDKSLYLSPVTSTKTCDDWRVNPSLYNIPERFSPARFLPVLGVDSSASCTCKIYVSQPEYFLKRFEESVKKYLLQEPFKVKCSTTKLVSTLMKECLQEVFKQFPSIPQTSDFCFRILGRTDILHPHAALGDHEYIQTCCRTVNDVYLIMEPYSMQELFLPTPEDRINKLNLHDLPAMQLEIPDRIAIEESVKKIQFYLDKLMKQIPAISTTTMVSVGETCGRLKVAVEDHISKICHRMAIYSLSETMESFQCCLHHLIRNKTRGQNQGVNNRRIPHVEGSSDHVTDQEAINKLAVLEMQVIRQTIAFLKWKQAWHPHLQLSIALSAPLIGSTVECERLLGCHIAEKSSCRRISKSNFHLVLCVGGVIDPNLQGSLNSTSFYRVHIVLTYAGRPLSKVCPIKEDQRNFADINRCPEYENTVPVHGDSYYSRRVDFKSNGKINEWIRFLDFRLRHLPRETMLNVSLIACKKETRDYPTLSEGTLLGWVNVPLFDPNGQLRQGIVLAGLWPPGNAERLSPEMRSTFAEPNRRSDAIVVELGFLVFEYNFYFTVPPPVEIYCETLSSQDRGRLLEAASDLLYSPLPPDQQQSRRPSDIVQDLKFTAFIPDRKPYQHLIDQLWSIRGRLTGEPELLMALLIAAPVCWPKKCRPEAMGFTERVHDKILWMNLLSQLYGLVQRSPPLAPAAALRLLLPDVSDQVLRHWAVVCIGQISTDAMICYLPSLVEAVNYDIYMDWSGLVSLLLHRATVSLRFCNALYWNIESVLMNPKWYSQQRLLLIKSALIWLRGSRLNATWKLQSDVLKGMQMTARALKTARDDAEKQVLTEGLQSIQAILDHRFKPKPSAEQDASRQTCLRPVKATSCPDGFRLPFDFGFCSRKIEVESCSYIPSFNRPIEIIFRGLDGKCRNCIYKVGDDLQVDLLMCQLIKICDRIWLNNALDLCIPHFCVMPQDPKCGLIELVTKSLTLREVNLAIGKTPGLLAWLEKMNDATYFKRALQNFLHSTVAGSVLTYVLGIGDRHNDNIMMRTNGQSFHIDFSKVFGNFQKFLGINRDRSPFILTPDMVEVIKAGEPTSACKPSGKDKLAEFPSFVHHCCESYNCLRKHALSIIGLLEMAWQMQLPGLERRQIQHVYGMLRQNISEKEAETYFKALILNSMESRTSRRVNEIHEFMQKTKKQPGRRGITHNEDGYTAQSAYAYLPSSKQSANIRGEIGLASISITDSTISRSGHYVKDKYAFWSPAFKFEILPVVNVGCGDDENVERRSYTITRDVHDLQRMVWRIRDANSHCLRSEKVLRLLSELDDQVKNCAIPTSPSPELLDELKASLVDFIQFYAKDKTLVTFWTQTMKDMGSESASGSAPVFDAEGSDDDDAINDDIFTRNAEYSLVQEDSTVPDCPAVKLTLQLSASCERLNVTVDQGHDWDLQSENLTMNCIIDARISADYVRPLFDQRSVVIATSNPVLSERFTLDIPRNQLENASLILTARQLDTIGARHLIGDAVVPLCTLPKQSAIDPNSNVVTRWYELSRRTFERV